MSITDHASRIRLPNCSKFALNWKNVDIVTIYWHDIIANFFNLAVFLLSCLFIGPSFISIPLLVLEFCLQGLTRNPEIRNIPVWVFPNIWRLRQVRDTKYGTNDSKGMLRDTVKSQSYSFYHFWVIKEKPTEGCKNAPHTN